MGFVDRLFGWRRRRPVPSHHLGSTALPTAPPAPAANPPAPAANGQPHHVGLVDGQDYETLRPVIGTARASGDIGLARELLTSCVEAAERVAARTGVAPRSWPTERAAILLRAAGDVAAEVAILERYTAHCPPGTGAPHLERRLGRARALLAAATTT